MKKYISLFILRMKQNLQAKIEYKFDFLLGNIATIIGQIGGIAFIWVIFQRIGDMNGWILPQIMMIYGIAALPFGLFELLFNGLWGLTRRVRMGDFDEYLVRPMGPLFWILSDEVAVHGFGNAVSGIVIIVMASFQLEFTWTIGRLLFLAGATISGIVIYTSINLITASMSFWVVGMGSSIMYLVQRFRDFTRYPLTIYSLPLRIVLLWILPFGFAGFVPSAILLQTSRYAEYGLFLPVVSIGIAAIAYTVWRLGLTKYQSTGS